MGAIAPVPDFSEKVEADFRASILEPSLRGLEKEGFDYRGFIFFGLMVRDEKCCLLEYNVRLGDPETQAVLMLLDSDFAGLCAAILDGSLADYPLAWKKGASCAPVAVAGGYPGPYQKGTVIAIDQAKIEAVGAKVFVAGAELKNGGLCTTGGRVLAVSAYAKAASHHLSAADAAWARAYAALEAVDFAGMGYRRDIGRE
jgi:phosphoribosylamine--glycine ligase